MAEFEALDLPTIDPRNEEELAEQALLKVRDASGGIINSFKPGSPTRALQEGFAFSAAEVLFYANRLPLAMVMQLLILADVERRLGTPSQATLTFTLTSALLDRDFYIPQSYIVTDNNGELQFSTDEILVIPAGATEGSVTATCLEVGEIGNVGAFSLTELSVPLAFLQEVTNTEPATGGSDDETIESTIDRGLIAIRTRNLVSTEDYEDESERLLGEGSLALAVGRLAEDRVTQRDGTVHVFLLNPDATPPNSAEVATVQRELSRKIQIGTSVYCSPMSIQEVTIQVIAYMLEGGDPTTIAFSLWQAIQDSFKVGQFEGQTVFRNELVYSLRQVYGIDKIYEVLIDNQAKNLALPTPWTYPKVISLNVQLVDPAGNVFKQDIGTVIGSELFVEGD